jgi:hypothetical protein
MQVQIVDCHHVFLMLSLQFLIAINDMLQNLILLCACALM